MASSPTRQRISVASFGFRRCESQKVGFSTYDEALTVAERMMDANKVKPGCHITPYVCDRCGEYHVANCIIVPMGRRRVQVSQ